MYLDVISKRRIDQQGFRQGGKESLERVIHLFNAFLRETCGRSNENPEGFDPFVNDEYLKGVSIDEVDRKEYIERVTKLFSDFHNQFGVCSCVGILGFDPFRYDEYDEKTQERIEGGEWMKKCSEGMERIVRTICGKQ